MKLKMTLLAAAATVAISPAAQAYQGLYGAIGAGLNLMRDNNEISNDGPGSGVFTFDSNADYDKGIGVYTALGYAWGSGFRTELEFSYRTNDIDQIDPDGAGFSGWTSGNITGDTTTKAILANLIYDFNLGGGLRPYVGVGGGIANVDHDITGSVNPGAPTSPMTIAYGANKWVLAYQGIVGVSYDLTQSVMLDVSYRYFATDDAVYAGTLNGAPATFDAENYSHSIFAGLRWNFGGSTPAVQYKDCWDGSSVPVSADCPPQLVEQQTAVAEPIMFTVYFDYNKSNLTAQAASLIQEAATRALENDIDTVVVQGNTDTSGSSAYNQTLSERRAAVVRDALVADGVPADRIRVEALGESNPAKPTADGVREPLNRRSEVSITFE